MGAKIDIPTLEWFINGRMNYLTRSLSSACIEYTIEKAARELLASVVDMMGDYMDLGHNTHKGRLHKKNPVNLGLWPKLL